MMSEKSEVKETVASAGSTGSAKLWRVRLIECYEVIVEAPSREEAKNCITEFGGDSPKWTKETVVRVKRGDPGFISPSNTYEA